VAAPIPGLLAAMLKAERLSGVLRWKVNFSEPVISGEAGLAGWNYIWLDTSSVTSDRELVDVAAVQISKPVLLGAAISDLVSALVPTDTDQKTCIAWTNWQDLVKADLATAQNLAEQLDEACRDKSVVVIVCDSVGQFPGIAELPQG
jgi:hypothetical protein